MRPVALAAITLFAASHAALAGERLYVGTFGSNRVDFALGVNSIFTIVDCKVENGGYVYSAKIKESRNSALLTIYSNQQDVFGKTIATVRLEGGETIDEGQKVFTWRAKHVAIGKLVGDIALKRYPDPFVIGFQSDECDPWWDTEVIYLVIKPQHMAEALQWAKLQKMKVSSNAAFDDDNGEVGDKDLVHHPNLFRIDVPVGDEDMWVTRIKQLSWVIDVQRTGRPRGPAGDYIYFSGNSVFKDSSDQQRLRGEITTTIRATYPAANIAETDVIAEHGLGFSWNIKTPATKIAGADYKGYWLRAQVRMAFTHQLRSQAVADEMVLFIADGYLARHPEESVPFDKEFIHLDDLNQSDKYHDFTILNSLQKKMSNSFAEKWTGTVESD